MSNIETVAGLKPERFWFHLAKISDIPRESGNEAMVRQYVLDHAAKCGLKTKVDKAGNVLVKKPGSKKHKKSPSVALQGHLDMVCIKREESNHDFFKDPIRLVRDGNVLKADGTTAGFDNGVAVAVMCAIMEDENSIHGPLELLFTVEEETSMAGARGLKKGFLKSKTLIKLDSEEDGVLCIGCAGGRHVVGLFPLVFEEAPENYAPCVLKVSGLKGGHSGVDIHKQHLNAIKVLSLVLVEIFLMPQMKMRVAKIDGGEKHNVIPSCAAATLYFEKEHMARVRGKIEEIKKLFEEKEYFLAEPNLSLELDEGIELSDRLVLSDDAQTPILSALYFLPHGVRKMSQGSGGFVESSMNIAFAKMEKDSLTVLLSLRSLSRLGLEELSDYAIDMLERVNAGVSVSEGYGAWPPNLNSRVLGLAVETFEKMNGKKPKVEVIHAGLECAVIGEKYPDMDMISLGPTVTGVHSPNEKLFIDTLPKFYEFLTTLLAKLV